MDPTRAALLGGAVGIVLGVLVATSVRRRSMRSRPGEGAGPLVPPVPVPDGAAAVLAVLRSIAMVLDPAERVLSHSPGARALGLVDGDRLGDPQLADLVREVLRDGQFREDDLHVAATATRPHSWLNVRVAPLLGDHVLILVEDRSTEHRLEEVRRDFVVNVSHELKTPVGGLSLLAEAIADAKGDPEAVARFAARMQVESARLGRLIKEIVDLSRLQATSGLVESQLVSIESVVGEAMHLSQVEAEAKEIRMTARVETDAKVWGDHSLLVTAVRNLIGNAIAYSPPGSEIGIGGVRRPDGIRITVADHGRGIPLAEQERIFERFYRVDAARSRSTGGTGLGLAIVKHICSNHGGEVSLWSREGRGSTFTIRLPLPGDVDENPRTEGTTAA